MAVKKDYIPIVVHTHMHTHTHTHTSLHQKKPYKTRAYLVAQMVKNRPAMQETQIQFLGQEDPLGKGMIYTYIHTYIYIYIYKTVSSQGVTVQFL